MQKNGKSDIVKLAPAVSGITGPAAIYPGTFNPFTAGHLQVYEEAINIFGEVTILFSINPHKHGMSELQERERMKDMVAGTLGAKTAIHEGLVAEYCSGNNIRYLIRGLRATSDYQYETELAKFNAAVNPALKTVFLRKLDSDIPSPMIRALHDMGRDVTGYLPEGIFLA